MAAAGNAERRLLDRALAVRSRGERAAWVDAGFSRMHGSGGARRHGGEDAATDCPRGGTFIRIQRLRPSAVPSNVAAKL